MVIWPDGPYRAPGRPRHGRGALPVANAATLLFMTSSLGVTVGALAAGRLFDTFGDQDVLIGIGSMVLVFGVIPAVVGRRVSNRA